MTNEQIERTYPAADSPPFWEPLPRADGRMEWECPHGIGHGNHEHGCDGCCRREDYPGRGVPGVIRHSHTGV